MKRATATLLVLLSAALAFGFQGPTGWIKYNSPGGRYTVLFPREPNLTSQESTAATGEKVTQNLAASSDESSAVYMVGYFDSGPNTTFSFDKARDGMLAAIKGTLIAEKVISLGSYPGRELKAYAKDADGNEFAVLARFYQVGNRIYVVQLIVGKSSEAALSAPASVKYFDSFQVAKPK